MNISERLTRWLTETGMTAVLRADDGDACTPVAVQGWTFAAGTTRGTAVFGPYPDSVSASGVRISVDGANDDVTFGSVMALPAGQTYRYTLTIGVT